MKLSADGGGSIALRRSPGRRDNDSGGVLELGQKFLISCPETAGHKHPDLRSRRGGQSENHREREDYRRQRLACLQAAVSFSSWLPESGQV